MKPSTGDVGGEVDAVDELFRARWGPSVRLATALTGDPSVAEELVQDAFLEVSRRWEEVDNPAGFLRTVLVNRCRNHRRRLGVGRRHQPPPPRLTVEDPDLDETWQLLAALPERRRAALVLRYYEDLPIADIAALLGCRPGAVASLLHRGLGDLRKVLRDDD